MKVYTVVTLREALVFLFLLFLSVALVLYFFNGISSSLNWKGVKAFRKKDFPKAQTHFKEALIKSPFSPWAYMNLGLSYDLLDSKDNALASYKIVSSFLPKDISKKVAFFAYFNQGELNGRLENLDKALKNYQKALDFKYQQNRIKTNIELLFKDQPEEQENKPEEEEQKEQENKPEEEEQKEQENESEQEEQKGQEDKSEQDQPEADQNQQESSSNELNEKEQRAVLKEVEKQENKARLQFYKTKKQFNYKTNKDW